MCRKLETEQEKVLPFYASSLTEEEEEQAKKAELEDPTEVLAKVHESKFASTIAHGLKHASSIKPCCLAVIKLLERFRFGFQYLYRYVNLSFSQSDVSDLPD